LGGLLGDLALTTENKLKKIYDQALISNPLTSAKDLRHEVFIWKLVGGSKYLANVRIESVRTARNDFAIVPVEGSDSKVQELLGGQTFIDLYIPDSALLLRCDIKQTDAPIRYYVHIPKFVAQVERRKHVRLQVYESDEVKLAFSKVMIEPKPQSQLFKKSCFDVSSGGFSFLVSRIESKFFKINDPIRNIMIQVGDRNALVNAEIALIKEVEPEQLNGLTYKVWRICCRFSQIDNVTKKHLEMFILERIKEELDAI
jgi:hypothetical protein